MLKLFLFFILFIFPFGFGSQKVYELKDFFDLIENVKITEEDAQKLINNLKKILERYVYLDITKNPPQPQNKDNYYNKVNLIDDLEKINTKERSLYGFYREIKMAISKCQELHLDITTERDFGSNINLFNSFFVSPVGFYVKDEDKKVYALPTPLSYLFDPNIVDIIKANVKNPVRKINGTEPLEYIQNFNKEFIKLKSPNAQFSLNENLITGPFLQNLP